MTALHKQARAEADAYAQHLHDATPIDTYTAFRQIGDAFAGGFLAGHEAATRTRVVNAAAELDALPLGSVVLDADGDVWQMRERGLIPGSEWACTERAVLMSTGAELANAPFAPFRVLYEPQEKP
jgi:hypothetical protein